MMRKVLPLALPALMLAACANDGVETIPVAGAGACKHEGLESFVGQKATAELGAQLLKASGATILRWGPPNSAMTMDYREDRLTVNYDTAMMVTSVRCG